MSIRLLQLHNGSERRTAFVREPRLEFLTFPSTYELLSHALNDAEPIASLVHRSLAGESLDYDPIYDGTSDWRLLPPLTHPDAAHTLISGTGLTHLGSAKNRDAMHEKPVASDAIETDSMKMFRWGVESGKPPTGQIGIPPEWFHKGTAHLLRAHNQPLDLPPFAHDGGEEAEIAGLYLIDKNGNPIRIGMAQGNEFSDHLFEKKNYLNLAGSKLRTCSIGPELVINPAFSAIPGEVSLTRDHQQIWSKQIATGESHMAHALANIEHHHFKFPAHRIPGNVHIHFFGAAALSFGDNIHLQDADIMQVHFPSFGRPLRNPLRKSKTPDRLISAIPIP